MPKLILIADDEPHIRKVVELKLLSGGYDIKSVTNGRAAVEATSEYSPDLLITDYVMPGELTGIEVIDAIRRSPIGDGLPIILLTGSVAVPQKLTEAIGEVKKVTIMPKPFSPRELLKRVDEILED